MKKEILFKAKTVENDEWIYGNYVKATEIRNDKTVEGHWIYQCDIKKRYLEADEVKPETVCQLIYSKEHSIRVFEGDILEGEFSNRACGQNKAKYKKFTFTLEWNEFEYLYNIPHDMGQYRFYPNIRDCVVVGNIFDNKDHLLSK